MRSGLAAAKARGKRLGRPRSEDAEDQPAIGSRGIDAFVQTHEMDPESVEFGQCIDELPERTGKSIIAVDQHLHQTSAA